MFMVALGVVALLLVGCWLIYAKMVNQLTADQPGAVQMEAPSDAQFAAANDKLDRPSAKRRAEISR